MKVRIITNLGTNDFPDSPFKEGEVQEVDESLGNVLLTRKLATLIEEPPPIKAAKVETKPEPKQGPPVVAVPQPVVTQQKAKEK